MVDEPQSTRDANELDDEDISQNPGMRAAAIRANPKLSLEEARNANEGKAPNAAGGVAPSDAEDHVPSRSDPHASDLPSAGDTGNSP